MNLTPKKVTIDNSLWNTINIWFVSEKWKWNFGNLHTPQLAAGSDSERKYILLLRWKVQKSAMKMWAVATPKMDNMDLLANILRLLSGDLGEVGLDLHLSWHAGDHHWNHILLIFTIPLSSVVSQSSRILGPVDQNIPPNWWTQS